MAKRVYTFEPVGLDVWDRQVNQPPRGTRVVKTQSDPVAAAVAAASTLETARESYSRAVLRALDAGVSVSRLAIELGISRQAVNQLRLRARARAAGR